MARRLIITLAVVLAFLGVASAGRRIRPAETAEMQIDASFEHTAAGDLKSLHNTLVNGQKLKGIKVAEVERQMRNYDDLRDALSAAQEKERSWLLSNAETFDKPNNVAVDFFAAVNEAMNMGEFNHDLASEFVKEAKEKREAGKKEQEEALQTLEQTQEGTRKAAQALAAHVKAMEALVEKSKRAELEKEEQEVERDEIELSEQKPEKVKKAEKKTEKTEKKSEKAEKKAKKEEEH